MSSGSGETSGSRGGYLGGYIDEYPCQIDEYTCLSQEMRKCGRRLACLHGLLWALSHIE